MTGKAQSEPAGWLRELARSQPAQWSWGRSLRAAIAVGTPLAVGLATGQFAASLWVSMGTLIAAGGEGAGTYRSRFRQMAIAAPIGACGYLAGHMLALPYPAVIAAMTGIAFLAGIVNSYGAAYSIGTMQLLMLAALAIGLPDSAGSIAPPLLFLAGNAFYAALLWVETLIDRRRPERQMLGDLIAALGQLAALRAAMPDGPGGAARREAVRRTITDTSRALYAALLDTRRGGRTHETVTHAEILDATDSLFTEMIGCDDPARLTAMSDWLASLSQSVLDRAPMPALTRIAASDGLTRLAAAMNAGAFALHEDGGDATVAPRRWSLRNLAVGSQVLQRAMALALCIGAGFATRYVLHEDHWYWVPLTVALVMKPDLGSVFVRAVLRSAGTIVGVGIGTAMLILLPKGFLLVGAIALLALLLPLAKTISYGAQAVVLTPLVLVLIDLIAPTLQTVNYGAQRLTATVIGSAIALVLGYFIWPRRHGRALAAEFGAAMSSIADCLVATCAQTGGGAAARWTCYAQLSNLRATLGRSMAEPPPAGREAAGWFPLVAAAERLCDQIAARAAVSGAAPPAAEVALVAAMLRSLNAGAVPVETPPLTDPFLSSVATQTRQIARRMDLTIAPLPTAARGGTPQ